MTKTLQLIAVALLVLAGLPLQAQDRVWVFFRDKGPEQTTWQAHPGKYLSPRALERRTATGVQPDHKDIPVSPTYKAQLQKAGLKIHATSRWINAVSIEATLSLQELQAICPAIIGTQPVAKFTTTRTTTTTTPPSNTALTLPLAPHPPFKSANTDNFSYGDAQLQIDQLNLECLHQKGKTGRDVLIAIFDAGFLRADTISAFDSLWMQGRVLTYYDFVNQDSTVFDENNHGLHVMSTIVAHIPGDIVGTAPHATVALARTEDVGSETNQEEDNWMMAVEWADSLGADMIQSSLGYTTFDAGQTSYTYADLDGNTTIVSRAADIAASRGILVVSSAGNEGSGPWHYISSPCDADSVLCVGAVDFLGGNASFSGVGPSADGQVKPDVCALGVFTAVVGSNGQVGNSSGTSFAAPLMAGMAACLVGAHPQRTNMEIIRAIRESASQFLAPDTLLGYGIPDACKADSILTAWDSFGVAMPEPVQPMDPIGVFPNPTGEKVVLENSAPANPIQSVQVITVDGKLLMQMAGADLRGGAGRMEVDLQALPAGTYIMKMVLQDRQVQSTRIVRN
jgi:serine protease AprX